MRIDYGSEGYVQISRSRKPNHINIIVASRQPDNPLELVANTAEIPMEKFIEAYAEIIGSVRISPTKSVEDDAASISDAEPSNEQGS